MSGTLSAFFKPKPRADDDVFFQWKALKSVSGATTRVEVNLKARVGSYVVHTVHGKVKLISQPDPLKLEVEVESVNLDSFRAHGPATRREVVNAIDCTNPTALPRARDASSGVQLVARLCAFQAAKVLLL